MDMACTMYMEMCHLKFELVGYTEVFLHLATTKAKAIRGCRVTNDHNCFGLVTLVQTRHTLQTATNSIIVCLRFTLFTFSVARSDSNITR